MSFKAKMLLCYAGIYLIWGSTYLAVKFSLETIPPILMGGVRYLLAGLILLAIMFIKKEKLPSTKGIINGSLIGILMFTVSQSLVFTAAKELPSAIVALLCAISPILISFLDRFIGSKKRLTFDKILGIFTGFLGVYFLVKPDGGNNFFYMSFILVGAFLWSFCSMMNKKIMNSVSQTAALAIQLLSGGFFMTLLAIFRKEHIGFNLGEVSLKSGLSWIFLVTFGTVIVFSCYMWLLKNCDVSKVSTYAFINPVIAVFLGSFLGNEPLTFKVLSSASIIIIGVIIILFGNKLKVSEKIILNKKVKELNYGTK